MVGLERLELSTPRLSSVCSNQLSYRPSLRELHLLLAIHKQKMFATASVYVFSFNVSELSVLELPPLIAPSKLNS